MFLHIYTHFHVSHFCIYLIISVFVDYTVKKGYKLLLCSCLINLYIITGVTFDLVA